LLKKNAPAWAGARWKGGAVGVQAVAPQNSLSRRLRPLAYALVAVVVLILALTYGALQIQVTLAGFLNGESVWSKAQKQSVIDLAAYAANGDSSLLTAYRQNHAVLDHDRFARDQIAAGQFDHAAVGAAFRAAGVIPEAIPGMIFILNYFDRAPYIKEAMTAWRSTDSTVDDLDGMADELERQWRAGSVSPAQALVYRQRIEHLNDFIEPRSRAGRSRPGVAVLAGHGPPHHGRYPRHRRTLRAALWQRCRRHRDGR
jgi:hypothetical protein